MQTELCNHLFPPGPLPGKIPTACSKCGKLESEYIMQTEQEKLKESWQTKFLNEGTANGCGDLSIMISVVSDLLSSQKQKMVEILEEMRTPLVHSKDCEFQRYGCDCGYMEDVGYNACLSDIKQRLEEI